MKLTNHIDSIQSREDFIAFVKELSKDFEDNRDSWENINIAAYLEALAAWTHDMDGYYKYQGESIPQDINWSFIARLLYAAKIYE